MARQPYPLEALRKLRDERAEALARKLAAQVARCDSARATLAERERARREQEERTRAALVTERERLELLGVSGADLLRLSEFERGAHAQAAALHDSAGRARQDLDQELAEELKLRDQLTKLEAEAKLVRKHEASFHERHAEREEQAEEAAALEQWSARRH
jgi:hypothetical protein